jgi:hypothetical protein
MNKTPKPETASKRDSEQHIIRSWLKINYGLNRLENGKTRHAYGKLRCKGDWKSDKTHRHIRELILKRNPGWMITGYALISPKAPTSFKAREAA